MKDCVQRCLPPDFELKKDARILDLGCGVGRFLYHLQAESEFLDLWGCDIDAESIAWLKESFSDRFTVFVNGYAPPLDVDAESFDAVVALSVLTHIPEIWAEWMAEMKRILKPGGVALVSYQGDVMFARHVGDPDRLRRHGMIVDGVDNTWEQGGPQVYHSHDWIARNWSRHLPVHGLFVGGLGGDQSLAVLRKSDSIPDEVQIFQPFIQQTLSENFEAFVDHDPFISANWWIDSGWFGQEPFYAWFVSRMAPLKRVSANIEDTPVPVNRVKRPDVAAVFPDHAWAGESGIHIDSASFPETSKILTLRAHDAQDNTHEVTVQVKRVTG